MDLMGEKEIASTPDSFDKDQAGCSNTMEDSGTAMKSALAQPDEMAIDQGIEEEFEDEDEENEDVGPVSWEMLSALLGVIKDRTFQAKIDAMDQLYFCVYYAVTNEHPNKTRELARPPSVSGKSEVTKVNVSGCTYAEFLEWRSRVNLMEVILRNNLHQDSFVERIERILRVLLITSKFDEEDFKLIWDVKTDNHDTIQKNIYNLVSRLAFLFNEDVLTLLSKRIVERWSCVKSYKDRKNLFDLMYKICHDELRDSFYNNGKTHIPGCIRTVLKTVWTLIPLTTDTEWVSKLMRLHVEMLERMVDVYKNSRDCIEYLTHYCCTDMEVLLPTSDPTKPPKPVAKKFLAFRHLSLLVAQKIAGAMICNLWKQHKKAIDTVRSLLNMGSELEPHILVSEEYLTGIYSVIEFCENSQIDLAEFGDEAEPIVNSAVSILLDIVSDEDDSDMRKETPSEAVIRLNLEVFRRLVSKIRVSRTTEFALGPTGLVDAFLNKYLFPASKALCDSENSLKSLMNDNVSAGIQQIQRSSTTSEISQHSDNSLSVASIPKSATMCDLPLRQRVITFSPDTLALVAASLVELSWLSLSIYKYISDGVSDLFLNEGSLPIDVQWDFEPQHTVRRTTSFVGLKNAGATCYMNAVFQQMFWALPIRQAILDLDLSKAASAQPKSGDEMQVESQGDDSANQNDSDLIDLGNERPELSYACQIVETMKEMFINLQDTQLAFHNPRAFWEIFRSVGGLIVSTRVQEDANEFWVRLSETIDNAFAECGEEKVFEKLYGGAVAVQKVGLDCPHRFETEESFLQHTIDITHPTLPDSLQQALIGERLDNDNAYHCPSCDKKVAIVKRECFKKLPPILGFHLRRFGYDWDRSVPLKMNDFFAFPMDLDMYPYTAEALEEKEALQAAGKDNAPSENANKKTLMYRLKGVVVHTGEAEGGHYYSFVRLRDDDKDGTDRWYKFDDIDINESAVGPEQWFGGDQDDSCELFRSEARRHKRRYNAYIIIYEHIGDKLLAASGKSVVKADVEDPSSSNEEQREKLEKKVTELQRLHMQAQYSDSYFFLMTHWAENLTDRLHSHFHSNKLGGGSKEAEMSNTMTEYLVTAVEVFSYFLFSHGLHAHRAFMFPLINEPSYLKRWKRIMHIFLDFEVSRNWFCVNILMHRKIIQLYLLEAPLYDIRVFMMELINMVLMGSERCSVEHLLTTANCRHDIQNSNFFRPDETVSQVFIRILMTLPNNAGSSLLQHPDEFFLTLLRYCSSPSRRDLLIRSDVLYKLLIMCLDDVHVPQLLRGQRHLLNVVALLLRSLLVFNSLREVSFGENPYRMKDQTEGIPMPQNVASFFATVDQMKKVVSLMLEECVRSNAGMSLAYETMAFLSFENMLICKRLLNVFDFEQFNNRDAYDLYLCCFFSFLSISDSCQGERVRIGLCGETGGFKGFIPIVHARMNRHYGRTYMMLKKLLLYMDTADFAIEVIKENMLAYAMFEELILWFDSKISRSTWAYEASSNDLSHSCRARLARTSSAVSLLVENDIVKEVLDRNNPSKSGAFESEQYTVAVPEDDPMLPSVAGSSKYDSNSLVPDRVKYESTSWDYPLPLHMNPHDGMRDYRTSQPISGGMRRTSTEPDGIVLHDMPSRSGGHPSSPVSLRRCAGQDDVNLSPIYDEALEQNLELYPHMQQMDEDDPLPQPDRIDPDDFEDDFEDPPEPEMNDASDEDEGNDRVSQLVSSFSSLSSPSTHLDVQEAAKRKD